MIWQDSCALLSANAVSGSGGVECLFCLDYLQCSYAPDLAQKLTFSYTRLEPLSQVTDEPSFALCSVDHRH
jgi:hypothetical protein